MPPNWEDQFDFDDVQPKQAVKKGKQQKKVKKNEDDFFDLQDDPPQKASKLPVINPKPKENSQSKIPAEKSNKNTKNVYDNYQEIDEQVQEVKSPLKNETKKAPSNNDYYEQLEQEKPKKALEVKKQPSKPIKKSEEDQQFYESLQDLNDIKQPKQEIKAAPIAQKNYTQNNSKQEQEIQSEYGDQYGQDFQELQEKPKEILPKKSQTTVNLKSKEKTKEIQKPKAQEKKLVINTNKVFTNKEEKEKDSKNAQPTIPKPPQKENSNKPPSKKYIQPVHEVSKQKALQKSSSKKSLQSNDSKKYLSNSKVSVKRKTAQISSLNRHIELVEKQFPQSQDRIKEYNNDKLSRLNEQVRQMIRKFNEQLNELINKNMILLKDKPPEKQTNVDDKVRVLQEQLKSGATAIQVIENELERLKGREGQLREQQYQLIMEKRIEETKQVIKQTTKQIVKLKFDVNNEGNKLSKHQVEKKLTQQLHQIKMMLIQTKKQQEKNDLKLQKIEKMAEELQSKNSDKEYELSEQIDSAKDKGVYLNVNSVTKKRYDQLKLKVQAVQNHKKCMQGLNKTKCDHLNHQNDQIRINIKNIESQVNNLYQSIQHSQEQSIAIIKKAKENPKISTVLADNLDKILRSIEQNQAINFYQVRTEGNKSQASERPLKNSMYENMSKEKPPMRTNSSKKEPISASKQKPLQSVAAASQDQINLMKPNFMKKKEKHQLQGQQKPNKLYERVWSQDQERKKQQEKKKQQDRKKQQQQKKRRLQEQKKKEAQRQQAIEQEKKKPFNLKKNRQNKEKSIQQSPQIKIQKKPQVELTIQQTKQNKQQEKPSLGPKFMRLNKKEKNNDVNISTQKPVVQEIKKVPEQIKIETKTSEQEPVFVPKRFNLRNKIEKKEESYVPTIDKNPEIKEKKQQPKQVKKQYAPNFSFKEQDPFKAPAVQPKKPQNDKIAEVIEEKPRFNLRLRDRKKENDAEYVPTKLTEPIQTKPKIQTNAYNPFDKVIANKDEKVIPIKKQEEKSYMPSFKSNLPEKEVEKPIKLQANSNLNNPTKPVNNPYAQPQKQQVVNPYAPKEDQLPKRQKEGPLKKNKLLNKGPKEKINIYQQVEDITEPHIHIPVNEPPKQQINLAKTDELDLNAMLGIKKKDKGNDLDDLLGQIKVEKKKQKKKNTDFFNDLEI